MGASPVNLEAGLLLAEADLRLALVEGLVFGMGGSSRDLGAAAPGLNEHYWTLCQSLEEETVADWWRFSLTGIDRLKNRLSALMPDEAWNYGGMLQLAVNEAEMQEMVGSAHLMREAGFEYRLMGGAAASNYAPVGECEGAAFLPGAVCFDPLALWRRTARSLAASGALVLEEQPVLRIDRGAEGLTAYTAGGITIECEMAIVAAGSSTWSLIGGQGQRLFPVRGQGFATPAVRERPRSSSPLVCANRHHEWYRGSRDGGMLVSGLNPASGFKEMTDVAEVDEDFQRVLEGVARDRMPEIARVEASSRWACVHTFSVDGLPLIGAIPGQQRLLFASGFANRSWSLGIAAGAHLAGRLLGEEIAPLPPGCSPRRFL